MTTRYSIILGFVFAVIASSQALPSNASVSEGLSDNHGARYEARSTRYRLATLPSMNRKKVDAMCIKFLSLIPKAMLIPKTEEKIVYRVVTDNYDTLEIAKKRKAELSPYCESPFILKENSSYYVIASSFVTEESAQAEQKMLADRKIKTLIVGLKLPLKHWQMKSKESFTLRDAVSKAGELSKAGVVVMLEPADN